MVFGVMDVGFFSWIWEVFLLEEESGVFSFVKSI